MNKINECRKIDPRTDNSCTDEYILYQNEGISRDIRNVNNDEIAIVAVVSKNIEKYILEKIDKYIVTPVQECLNN